VSGGGVLVFSTSNEVYASALVHRFRFRIRFWDDVMITLTSHSSRRYSRDIGTPEGALIGRPIMTAVSSLGVLRFAKALAGCEPTGTKSANHHL
jgi:hypothetical protein